MSEFIAHYKTEKETHFPSRDREQSILVVLMAAAMHSFQVSHGTSANKTSCSIQELMSLQDRCS